MMITLAWRNIWRNKRRSLITLSSIAFAVIFSTLMMSVQRGSLEHLIDNSVKFYSGHFQIQHAKYWNEKTINNSLIYTDELLANLSEIEGVVTASPRVESFALVSYNSTSKATMVLGVDPKKEEHLLELTKKLKKGKLITNDSKGVLIGEGLAAYLKVDVNDTLVLISQGYHGVNAAALFPIDGILKFPNPVQNKQLICMSLKEAQWFYDLDMKLTSIVLLLDDYKKMPVVEKQANQFIDADTHTLMNWQDMIPELIQTAEMKYSSARIMIFILYAVIGFGMFGTFLMMTAERMREFGMMLAIGMNRISLQLITFLEILLLSAFGVLVGLALGVLIITYFNFNPIQLGSSYDAIADMYGMEMAVEFSIQGAIFYTQAFAVFIIAFILSFYPLIVINKIKPVEAIREG